MKNIISKIIRTGCTTSKKPIEDFINYLYPLRHIITCNPKTGLITCNDNPFWNAENIDNRKALVYEISNIRKHNITDHHYFSIINRFEHGDKFGIVTD